MASMTSMPSRRKGRRSDRRDGAKGPVRVSAAAASQRPDGRGSPRRSPAPRGAAGITARSSAAARAAATTDGITGAADSEGSPAQGSPPQGPSTWCQEISL